MMDAAAAIGSLLTRYDLVACRPTGLPIILNKAGYLIFDTNRVNDYARLQVGDLCAGDWYVEQRAKGRTESGEAA
jgi:hypothetical protein